VLLYKRKETEMKIVNSKWFPAIKDYTNVANVDQIILYQDDDSEVAGAFDPDENTIMLNLDPDVLSDIASRFNLPDTDLEHIAMAVFFEECAHSQGEENEEKAAKVGEILAKQFSKKYFEEYTVARNDHVIELVRRGGILTAFRMETEDEYSSVEDEESLIDYVNKLVVKKECAA
jgi:hypothetical protein